MKKIINWSFGSFFRTIGRFFAFFLIGILILIIGAKSGLKLFLMPVKATVTTNWASSLPQLDRAQLYDCTTNNSCTNVLFQTQGLTVEPNTVRNILTSNGAVTIGKGGVAVQVYSGSLKAGYLYQTSIYICSNKDLGTASIYSANYDSPGITDSIYWATTTQGLSGVPGNGDHEFNTCRVYSGLFVPNSNGGWIVSRFTNNTNITNAYPSLIGYETEELGIYSETIKNIIQNSGLATAQTVEEVKTATEQVKEEAKKTNDTLNNDNVDESLTEADSFFNDFTTNTHGLTGIITAPLNAIQSLTSKTCSPLVLPLPFVDKDLTLPCMRQIYVDNFGAFMNLYDVIIIGIFSYWILVRIFTLVKDFKNPDHDEVEVMDL